MDPKEEERQLAEIIERIKTDGVATASTKDGRIFFFSVQALEGLIEEAHKKDSEYCSFLIKDPNTLN